MRRLPYPAGTRSWWRVSSLQRRTILLKVRGVIGGASCQVRFANCHPAYSTYPGWPEIRRTIRQRRRVPERTRLLLKTHACVYIPNCVPDTFNQYPIRYSTLRSGVGSSSDGGRGSLGVVASGSCKPMRCVNIPNCDTMHKSPTEYRTLRSGV